jgi:hypothetical protein
MTDLGAGGDPVLPLGPLIVRLSSSIATAAVLRNLDIHVLELFLGVSLQVAGERAEHRGSGFDQQGVGSWVSISRSSRGKTSWASSATCPRSSLRVGPTPMTANVR